MENKQTATRATSRRKPSEVEELKAQLVALSKKLDAMSSGANTKKENSMDEDDGNDVTISSDTYVKVMSLTPYRLTLTTEEHGRGKKFDFLKFGEVKRILYHDLTDIMEQHPNFLNEGYYIILNRDVVRKHGLDETYASILTKEKIEAIISGNDTDAVNMFKACGDAQKDSIVAMIHDKMLKNEFVDLNLLDRFSRVIGYNIAERGEEMRKIAELKKA